MVHGSEMPVALCCSSPGHAVAASLRPLSKAFEGEPWGRREDGTLTWASVQEVVANKRGFFQTNGASTALV